MSTSSISSPTSVPTHPYKTFETTEPSSGRMAVAIAGYPYSSRAAILDIVDNSVAARATGISINLPSDPAGNIVIADKGTGIAPEILPEVLRAGSRVQDRYEAQSLSRYGIGLKGAGFSLGNKIVVLTRFADQPVRRRAIDLRVIQAADEWIQDTREPSSVEQKLFETTIGNLPGENGKGTGTVVIISGLNLRSREISKLKTDIARGLGETYQKFLNRGLLKIRINDIDIEPIDPLHRENPQTLVLYKREPIPLSNGATIYFSAVSLPHPLQVPQDLRRRYRYAQVNQGFYLYRNGRLLRSGETLGLFNYDFHLNAFRAEVEYSTDADEHINVDVAKSVVNVTPEVVQKLQEMVTICRKTCDTLWRERDVVTDEDINSMFDDTNKLIASRANLLVESIDARKKKARAAGGHGSRPTPAAGSAAAPAAVPTPPTKGIQPAPTATPVKQLPPAAKVPPRDIPYLQPVQSLPADVLYRPIWSGDVNAVVVQVNKSHPFYKAVFSSSSGEGRDSLPRAAATATQQLIFVLGATEWNVATDEELERLFEQYRRFASMNLRALLE
jgi:histidine kinase/DNA gyrase B/HSP90-like ATPase